MEKRLLEILVRKEEADWAWLKKVHRQLPKYDEVNTKRKVVEEAIKNLKKSVSYKREATDGYVAGMMYLAASAARVEKAMLLNNESIAWTRPQVERARRDWQEKMESIQSGMDSVGVHKFAECLLSYCALLFKLQQEYTRDAYQNDLRIIFRELGEYVKLYADRDRLHHSEPGWSLVFNAWKALEEYEAILVSACATENAGLETTV